VLVGAVVLGGSPRFAGPLWLPGVTIPGMPTRSPQPRPSLPPLPDRGQGSGPLAPVLFAVLLAVITAFILFLVLRVVRARLRRPSIPALAGIEGEPLITSAEVTDEPEPDAPVMRHGLQSALDALNDEREPSDAVVKAWLGLQEAAELSGVQRRSAETPTEFTTRVITRVHADEGAARELVDVYQAVRFGGHPITRHDVEQARDAIERLLASWHEPSAGRRR
jgi:hypothetical protein